MIALMEFMQMPGCLKIDSMIGIKSITWPVDNFSFVKEGGIMLRSFIQLGYHPFN